jgi:plastocyanin
MKNLMLFPLMLAAGSLFAQHTHQLVLQNDVFYPEFLVIEAGDPIELQLTGGHTLTEVSSGTFRAGGIVPNGGIHIGLGTAHDGERTSFTINEPGDYYFVSEARNAPLAKTRITVLASANTGVTADADQFSPVVYPNPADDQVRFAAHEHLEMMSVEAFDQSGRLVLKDVVRGNEPLNIMALPSGHYTLRLTDGMSVVYGVERLIVNRDLGGL